MKIIRLGFTALGVIAALVGMMMAMSTVTAQHDHGTPEGHDSHMMATPGAMDHEMASTGTGVVYMTITNDGDEDDALVSASSDRADEVMVHDTVVTNDIGSMTMLDGPLVIPAGESVTLEPAGLHMMLVNLTDDIRMGDTFDVTLTFEHAGDVTIPVTAVLDPEDADSEPVTVGDLTIEGVWSRPAPKIDGVIGTPVAEPAS